MSLPSTKLIFSIMAKHERAKKIAITKCENLLLFDREMYLQFRYPPPMVISKLWQKMRDKHCQKEFKRSNVKKNLICKLICSAISSFAKKKWLLLSSHSSIIFVFLKGNKISKIRTENLACFGLDVNPRSKQTN